PHPLRSTLLLGPRGGGVGQSGDGRWSPRCAVYRRPTRRTLSGRHALLGGPVPPPWALVSPCGDASADTSSARQREGGGRGPGTGAPSRHLGPISFGESAAGGNSSSASSGCVVLCKPKAPTRPGDTSSS